ncbi:MAG: hypothetical protein VX278_07395 [Myxococcota bacterium]|nr:hypothetical protein [Myxococcota bacterium]
MPPIICIDAYEPETYLGRYIISREGILSSNQSRRTQALSSLSFQVMGSQIWIPENRNVLRNGHPLSDVTPLRSGDILHLGSLELHIQLIHSDQMLMQGKTERKLEICILQNGRAQQIGCFTQRVPEIHLNPKRSLWRKLRDIFSPSERLVAHSLPAQKLFKWQEGFAVCYLPVDWNIRCYDEQRTYDLWDLIDLEQAVPHQNGYSIELKHQQCFALGFHKFTFMAQYCY